MTDEAFKKKSAHMSTNRMSEVVGPGTGISLHSAKSISVRQHGDTLAELTQRVVELSTQSLDTLIDEDAVYLEVVSEVKGRVYGLRKVIIITSDLQGKQAHFEDQHMDLMSLRSYSGSYSGSTKGCKKHC
ncbi:hypothetical protein Scep_014630 [Stephania cephalantha]|uniref:Uncharacterized protein n=1 Tax=Stephania cephalantha TaxID=152367 RepID=A0AAP0P0P4_9MAGN